MKRLAFKPLLEALGCRVWFCEVFARGGWRLWFVGYYVWLGVQFASGVRNFGLSGVGFGEVFSSQAVLETLGCRGTTRVRTLPHQSPHLWGLVRWCSHAVLETLGFRGSVSHAGLEA